MIFDVERLAAIRSAIAMAGQCEKDGDLHAAHLYVLEAQKLLLVAQAKLTEEAIFPAAETTT